MECRGQGPRAEHEGRSESGKMVAIAPFAVVSP